MKDTPFYSAGLRFTCRQCSACCRHESGFVFLSENDLERLSNECKMDYNQFVQVWCRWIPFRYDSERLSLKEKSNYDCVFWNVSGNKGCSVYNSRPLQCRAFPFWDSIIDSAEEWEKTGRNCPGINNGELHQSSEIAGYLSSMDEEPVIERRIPC